VQSLKTSDEKRLLPLGLRDIFSREHWIFLDIPPGKFQHSTRLAQGVIREEADLQIAATLTLSADFAFGADHLAGTEAFCQFRKRNI
jgi:hypothetical protein